MSENAAPVPTPEPAAWRRFLLVGAALLLVAGSVVLLFLDTFKLRHLVNQLSSRDLRAQADAREQLRRSTDPEADEVLSAAVADGTHRFGARVACADLLMERNRLVMLEKLGRTGDLTTRAVVLARLSREDFFAPQVVPDPTFQVEATVRAWLADARMERRHEALRMAVQMDLPGLLPLVRPLLERAAAEGAGREDAEMLLVAAADAVARKADCESVPKVLALAASDPALQVRLRTLEALERLTVGVAGNPPSCPGSLEDARWVELLAATLDAQGGDADFERNMRIKVLGMLERHPQWLPPLAARVRAVLDGPGRGAERRAALSALVLGKDAAIANEMGRLFHDRDFEVRSTAAQVADQVAGLPAPALWLGLVARESDTRAKEAMRQAYLRLQKAAGEHVGLPQALLDKRGRPAEQDRAVREFLEQMLEQGQAQGLLRDAWATAWFRWLAGQQGLTGADVEAAVAARAAAQGAMERRDAAAVKAAVEGAPQGQGGLWAYERGWLAAR
ncbi:MAG: hypothetical protein ACKOSS_02815 [Planctomycetia bacterium]